MKVNHFQLSTKCPFNCLNCIINKDDSFNNIINQINASPKGTLNLFFNLTFDNTDLPKLIAHIKINKQKFGLFYNGLAKEEYLKYNPHLILFPIFSTTPEKHDMFTGKQNYYNMISFLISLPKNILKPIIFFVTQENISETTDLSGLLISLKTQLYMQPLSFYEKDDLNQETMEYLKRISNQKDIFLLPIGNKTAYCMNWTMSTNLLQKILKYILNLQIK